MFTSVPRENANVGGLVGCTVTSGGISQLWSASISHRNPNLCRARLEGMDKVSDYLPSLGGPYEMQVGDIIHSPSGCTQHGNMFMVTLRESISCHDRLCEAPCHPHQLPMRARSRVLEHQASVLLAGGLVFPIEDLRRWCAV